MTRLSKTAAPPADTEPVSEAELQRRAEYAEIMRYLLTELFAYRNVEYVVEGHGREIVTKSSRGTSRNWVRGWFGINPETGEEEYYGTPIASDVQASRRVVRKMEEFDFGFYVQKVPGNSCWQVEFYPVEMTPGEEDWTMHENEAMAVCLAARAALEKHGTPDDND